MPAPAGYKAPTKKKKKGGGGLFGALSRIPGDFARGGWRSATGLPTQVAELRHPHGLVSHQGRKDLMAMIRGTKETVRHPLRDPFQSLMLALMVTPAGPAARVGAAGRATGAMARTKALMRRPNITRSYETLKGERRTVNASRSLLLNLARKGTLEPAYKASRKRALAGKRGGGYARKRNEREEFQRERRRRQLHREAPEGVTGKPLLHHYGGIANLPTQLVRMGLPLRPRYLFQNIPQSFGMMLGEYGPHGIAQGARMARKMRKEAPEVPADIRAGMGDPGMASFAIGSEGMPLAGVTHKIMHAASAPEARMREVAFYRSAQRRGFDTPKKIEALKKRPDSDEYQMVLQEAEEAMGAYSRLGKGEHGFMRSGAGIFYPMWKNLTRWGTRYPTQHPIQAGLLAQLGELGKQKQEQAFPGGLPPWFPYLIKTGPTKGGWAQTSNPQNIYQLAPAADIYQALAAPFIKGGLSPTRGAGASLVSPTLEALFGALTGQQLQTGWPLKAMGPNQMPAIAVLKDLFPSVPLYDLLAILAAPGFQPRTTKAYGKPSRKQQLLMYGAGPIWPRRTNIAELARGAKAERTRQQGGR